MGPQYNIIIINTDQQRHDTLGCAGHEFVQTPHIDHFSESAVRFSDCFTVSTLCVPSRVSFYTSQYVKKHGGTDNRMQSHINPNQWCFPAVLKNHGYRIAHCGKNHTFNDVLTGTLFDYWEEYDHYGKCRGCIKESDREVRRWRTTGHHAGYSGPLLAGLVKQPEPFPPEMCATSRIAEDAVTFLESQARDIPFFLQVSFPDPHWPQTVCEPFFSRYNPHELRLEAQEISWYDKPFAHFVQSRVLGFPAYSELEKKRILATYYAQISFIDTAIGRILSTLRSLSLEEQTIIIFTSDHGDFGGRYGLVEKTKAFYEPLIRVPLLMKAPGIPEGSVITAQVSTIDIMPTIFDILKLPLPAAIDGRSFLRSITSSAGHRTEIFCEVGTPESAPPPIAYTEFDQYHEKRTLHDGPFWFIEYTVRGKARMIRKNGWKLCRYEGDKSELYDLNKDPLELHNAVYDPECRKPLDALERDLSSWLIT